VRLVVSFRRRRVDAVARLSRQDEALLVRPSWWRIARRERHHRGQAGRQREPDGTTVLVASNSMVVAQVMSPNVGRHRRDLNALRSVAPQAIVVTAQPDFPAMRLRS